MRYIDKLVKLASISAVSGRESGLSTVIYEMFSECCDTVEIDKFYNVIGIIKGAGENKKKIIITAHMDEIGFLVKNIDENGFISITNIGGIDPKIMMAQEVVVHGKRELMGIIGAKPPHLLKPEEVKKAVKLTDLCIDLGMDRNNVKELVSIGDVVTFKPGLLELKGSKISSKSLDNRCGVAVLLEVMKQIRNIRISNDLYFVATSQEEVHVTGAVTAAYNLRPDAAVVIDVCHGDIPDASKDGTYQLGKGPVISIGPNLHKKMTDKIIEVAKDEYIPFQLDVEPGDTGTEAWAIQVSRSGVPTVLISIPLRYMHTSVETVNQKDMKNIARLTSRFIADIDDEMEGLICF